MGKPRLCIAPRWAAGYDKEWYRWLGGQEAVQTAFDSIVCPEDGVGEGEPPVIDKWVANLSAACGTAKDAMARTYFIGHSVGCQAIIRYLASLPEGIRAAGCVFIAGWWDLDEPWDSIRPWMDPDISPQAPPLDIDRARAGAERFLVLVSDNDPFTSDWRATQRAFESKLGAEVRMVPGAKHFNATESPAVLEALSGFVG